MHLLPISYFICLLLAATSSYALTISIQELYHHDPHYLFKHHIEAQNKKDQKGPVPLTLPPAFQEQFDRYACCKEYSGTKSPSLLDDDLSYKCRLTKVYLALSDHEKKACSHLDKWGDLQLGKKIQSIFSYGHYMGTYYLLNEKSFKGAIPGYSVCSLSYELSSFSETHSEEFVLYKGTVLWMGVRKLLLKQESPGTKTADRSDDNDMAITVAVQYFSAESETEYSDYITTDIKDAGHLLNKRRFISPFYRSDLSPLRGYLSSNSLLTNFPATYPAHPYIKAYYDNTRKEFLSNTGNRTVGSYIHKMIESSKRVHQLAKENEEDTLCAKLPELIENMTNILKDDQFCSEDYRHFQIHFLIDMASCFLLCQLYTSRVSSI